MSEHLRGSYSRFSPPELRLLLLGNIGCGKTSSADTILGQLSTVSSSTSRSCQLRRGSCGDRSVALVEAPRWYWSGGKVEDSVRKETARAMTLLEPGPHGILLLVPVNQFTEMEGRVPAELEEVFGKESLDHTLVLLTCGDYLIGRTVEEYLQKEHSGLRQVIERCRGRYHVINNRQRQDRSQVQELLEKVDIMVQQNGVCHMKSIRDIEFEKQVKERKQEPMEKYRAQNEEKVKTAASTRIQNAETLRSSDAAEEYHTTAQWRWKEERDEIEGAVCSSHVSNRLRSTPAPKPESDSELNDKQLIRTPSFRLNADGAILSQMSEVKSKKVITTFHHRINSFEEASPTSSPYSPTYSPSSPTFATSPSSFLSSSSPPSQTFATSPSSLPTVATSSSYLPSSSSPSFPNVATSPSSLPTVATSPSYLPSSSSPSFPNVATSPSSFLSSSSPPSQTFATSPSSLPTVATSSSYLPSSSSPPSQTFATSPSSLPTIATSSSYLPSSSSPSFPNVATSPSSFLSSSSPPSQTFATSPSSLPTVATSSSYLPSSSSPSFPNVATPPSSVPSSSLPNFPTSPSSSSPELRLVLIGRSGAGKSAAGNNILGREEFDSRIITQECNKKKALVEGRRVAVVDTPDWFNSECTPDEVRAQISSCVALSSPGPHAFLLCVPVDQPAKVELQALWATESVFGPDAVRKHTLVLFTHVDRLRASGKVVKNSVEEYIATQRGDLLKLVERCGDRFHVMETGEGGRGRTNVVDLLKKVEQTVKEAGGQFYSGPAFQEAEKRVRQKQAEIARERKLTEQEKPEDAGQLSSKRRYPYLQSVAEAEDEVREDEIEKTRDEAEMSVSAMNIESLPPITPSSLYPSLLGSVLDKMQSSAATLPKLLADSSVWVSEGAKQVKSSPVWGAVGSGAQNVQKMVVDSSVWEKVGAGAGRVSKLVGDRVPQVVVDGSAWVGSGAKAVAASPMWEKVGSGAKLMADSSMCVGAGIGAGAKNLAQSPVWGKLGSGAKMVAKSSVWEKIGTTAKQVPKVVIGGALLGLVLGVFLWGVTGGAVGAAVGSVATEVGRRKYSKKSTLETTVDAATNVERRVNDSTDSLAKQGEKLLKTE